MINVTFGVAKQNLEVLHRIINEAAGYGIWSVFYGDEEIAAVESIKSKVEAMHKEQPEKQSYPLELNFKECQVFKKIIVFYLTNNFKSLSRGEFETISDFILFVDDSLAFELEDNGI
ncbi:hypothetical protein NBE98_03215 [Clostridium swellfunianum]|uniref:hypothetical protein n=1 Tax=Clostridium swellfunianum TaxID=1367462 RepID=UPI00202EEE39|nr:hypothetical protein [Clostridium swellfunianum]MCM0647385.1 hypothetical protein [Clostridium swellfunianum]